jgi:hypothetical protein
MNSELEKLRADLANAQADRDAWERFAKRALGLLAVRQAREEELRSLFEARVPKWRPSP